MHNPRPKLRRRVTEKQAKDIQNLAKVSEDIHSRNQMLEALFRKLNRIWANGIEDEGRAEDGTKMYRRTALLMSIRGEGEEYPDVIVVLDQMPDPGCSGHMLPNQPDASVVQ